MTSDSCNKIFLKKGQSKAVGTYLSYFYMYFLVLICWTCHGNDSAGVAPCTLHMTVTEEYFLALSAVEHCLTISFYFCICREIAQNTTKECLREQFHKILSV